MSHPALEQFIARFQPISEALIDSWFIVDSERTVVAAGRALLPLLSRAAAREVIGRKCHDVLALSICDDRCIARQCWREKRPVRLDEIEGRPAGGSPRWFVLSALPIVDDAGQEVGALEIQRDVTDEAVMQGKYQGLLDAEARERERLEAQIRGRTRALLEANQALLEVRRELLAFKRGMKG